MYLRPNMCCVYPSTLMCIFPFFFWQCFLVIQVPQSHSCWTAHPTTCTWPSSLTSASLLLASIWSTQVWGEMSCLAACHLFLLSFCFHVSVCHLSSSCFWMVERKIELPVWMAPKRRKNLIFCFSPVVFQSSGFVSAPTYFFLFGRKNAHISVGYLLKGIFAKGCREFKQWASAEQLIY